MGKLYQGMFGPITGKVGDTVYYVLNGQNVARHMGKRMEPFSEAQLGAQYRMKLVNVVLKTSTEFLNVGFMSNLKWLKNSAYNRAVSYNLKNAIAGIYPDCFIDFSKVLMSKGILPGAVDVGMEPVAEGLQFTWSSLDLPYPRGNDQAMLLAYFPSLGSAIYSVEAGYRSVGSAVLPVPADLLGERMEVYLSFVAADRKSVSDSDYLGRLN